VTSAWKDDELRRLTHRPGQGAAIRGHASFYEIPRGDSCQQLSVVYVAASLDNFELAKDIILVQPICRLMFGVGRFEIHFRGQFLNSNNKQRVCIIQCDLETDRIAARSQSV